MITAAGISVNSEIHRHRKLKVILLSFAIGRDERGGFVIVETGPADG
jgi:hypothetical protein